MRPGSSLPRYQCVNCKERFAARNGFKPCPKCGYAPTHVPHRNIALGYDGVVRQFAAACPEGKERPLRKEDATA